MEPDDAAFDFDGELVAVLRFLNLISGHHRQVDIGGIHHFFDFL